MIKEKNNSIIYKILFYYLISFAYASHRGGHMLLIGTKGIYLYNLFIAMK